MKSNMIKCWFLLVLLALAACQEKEELASTAKGNVSLKASIENSDARTSVDEEGHVSWVVADAIGVFGEETENARFQSISSGSEVLFIGDMSSHQDVPFLAYYPYDENASLDGNALQFTLPSSYTYTGQSQAPMLGVKQADGSFVFKHLCGLLKVKVKNMPENAKRLFVVSEGTEDKEAPAITGDVLVNDVTADNATLNITQNKGHEVSIDLKNTSAQETYTFYIPVPVGEYPMLSVKLEMNDGVINMDKSISNVNMRRAMMLDMPLIDLLEKKPDLGENMVLSDNTKLLTKEFEGYVCSAITDDGVINLDLSFPKEELPEVGDILFYGDISDIFPKGFLGRILQVENNSNGYKLITEPASLQESFDKLCINQEQAFQILDKQMDSRGIEDNPPFRLNASRYQDEEGYAGYTFEYSFVLNLPGPVIDFSTNNDKYNFSISGKYPNFAKYGGSCVAIKFVPNIFIDKNQPEKEYISLRTYIKKRQMTNLSIESEGTLSYLYKMGEWSLAPMAYTPQGAVLKVIIDPYVSLEYFLEATGEFEKESSESHNECWLADFYWGNHWTEMDYSFYELIDADNDGNMEVKSWEVNGETSTGFSISYGYKFFLGALDVSLSSKLGLTVEAELKNDNIKDENGNVTYDLLKNKSVDWSIDVSASCNAKSPIFEVKVNENKPTWGLSIPLRSWKIPIKEFYYVPNFENLIYKDQGYEFGATYNVSRDLILPVDISLGLIQSLQKSCESENIRYWNKLFTPTNEINHTFVGLNPFEDYEIRPIVVTPLWGEVYAEPVVERKAIKVYTGDNEKDNFTNSILCYGRFENVDDKDYISEYGICYNLQSEPAKKYLVPSEFIKDDFTFFASLSYLESGIYEYKSYVKIGEEYYYADETKTFEVEPEEKGTIITGEVTNITQTTATLSGNIQGYGADDFQHRYGIIYSTDTTPTASNGTVVYSNNIQEDGNYSVDVASLTQNTTYYYRAFVIDGGNYVYGDVKSFITLNEMSERDILIAFYKATDGDNWRNNTNWCSDEPLNKWYGVTTDEEGRVIRLSLNGHYPGYKFGLKGNACLSGLKNLESLSLHSNELVSLDVSGCNQLVEIYCGMNQLTEIKYEKSLCLKFLSLTDNKLSGSFNLSGCSNLESLFLDNNNLVSLDLSGCNQLVEISCCRNQLTEIKYEKSLLLEELSLFDNKLTGLLDLSGCSNLKTLNFMNNAITNLDLSGCSNLSHITCDNNKITDIDTSELTNLSDLSIGQNQLTTLDLTHNKLLSTLWCGGNLLNELKIEGCDELRLLYCYNNNLNSLTYTSKKIEYFYCYDNNIESLDLNGQVNLINLQCSRNRVESLDFSDAINIEQFGCIESPLKSLYFPNNEKLEYLVCKDNNLSSLDLSKCINIRTLKCQNNQLTSLNVQNCTALKTLHCDNNQLSSLNVLDCMGLEELHCENNQLVSLFVSDNLPLKILYCRNNKILQEITDWHSQLSTFKYDVRYNYTGSIYENGQWITLYEDNGVGWWYPGEPDRGYHKR